MTNAMDWLERYGLNDQLPNEPRRSCPLPERVGTGDVYEDGSIRMRDGCSMIHGCVWLDGRRARAAAYYGWTLAGYETGYDKRTGATLFPMRREV